MNRFLFPAKKFPWLLLLLFASCTVQRKTSQTPALSLLEDSILLHAQLGVAVFDPQANRFIYDYNGGQYFVPASNTKLFTCYAALKYLGDSIPGVQYAITPEGMILFPTGDPSFLHTDFPRQPVMDFLRKQLLPTAITDRGWEEKPWGPGWSWDDYNEPYMPERSPFPLYGNVLRWIQEKDTSSPKSHDNEFDQSVSIYSLPEVNWKVRFNPDMKTRTFHVQRELGENVFYITQGREIHREQEVPFVTNGLEAAVELMPDTLGRPLTLLRKAPPDSLPLQTVYSRPLDSLLRPMMFRSDNFFAEQTLLMLSQQRLHLMSDARIIDTLLQTDLKGLPQTPRWVDGSGLSRYNLFSPKDFVWLLQRLQQEFGMNRLRGILPTPGEGTLSGWDKKDSGYLYLKTGSMSGVMTFSGYLYTKRQRLLLFSLMLNNYRGSPAAVRHRMELFLEELRNKN